MRSGLLRSTPFRLVLILGGTFLVGLALAATVAFTAIHNDLMDRMDRDLRDTSSILIQAYDANDLQDLVDLVQAHMRATVDGREVYLLADASGRVLAGNLPHSLQQDGLATVSATDLADGLTGNYRLLQSSLGTYRLVVGRSLTESDEIGFLVLTVLAWTSAILAAVIVLIGAFLAAQGQRRLDSIAGTMERVSRGSLAERIPLTGRSDDIDALVGRVNSALDRLAGLVEGMRQVSADIAHELRTPLNRLSIVLTTAQQQVGTDAEIAALLEEAQGEIGQVITTFDAMLRIAQIESGARKARFTSVPARPILERLAEAYGPVASDNGQALSFEVDGMGRVLGDPDLLAQAIANLIENAIRHCSKGALIRLVGRRENDDILILVADNGPGIPDADKPHVFDRLYRVEKSRTTPGNGLGLALVKAIADLHGAQLGLVDNDPGTVVSIRIPVHGDNL